MKKDEQYFVDLKRKIDNAKTKVAELSGQKQTYLKQAQNDWKCNNLKEVDDKIDSLVNEKNELELKLKQSIEEFELKFDNN